MNINMKRIAVALIGIFLCLVAPVQAIDLAVTQITSNALSGTIVIGFLIV